MKICTFFGHRDCPGEIRPFLRAAILSMIQEQGVDTFYVGHQGAFDRMVVGILQMLVEEMPAIRYTVVLAYLTPASLMDEKPLQHTLFPEGLEFVPRRFAIAWRNEWLIKHCDCVIAYAVHHCGNAARYAAKAEKKGKKVVYLH